jgi:hypothetical protein
LHKDHQHRGIDSGVGVGVCAEISPPNDSSLHSIDHMYQTLQHQPNNKDQSVDSLPSISLSSSQSSVKSSPPEATSDPLSLFSTPCIASLLFIQVLVAHSYTSQQSTSLSQSSSLSSSLAPAPFPRPLVGQDTGVNSATIPVFSDGVDAGCLLSLVRGTIPQSLLPDLPRHSAVTTLKKEEEIIKTEPPAELFLLKSEQQNTSRTTANLSETLHNTKDMSSHQHNQQLRDELITSFLLEKMRHYYQPSDDLNSDLSKMFSLANTLCKAAAMVSNQNQ